MSATFQILRPLAETGYQLSQEENQEAARSLTMLAVHMIALGQVMLLFRQSDRQCIAALVAPLTKASGMQAAIRGRYLEVACGYGLSSQEVTDWIKKIC